MLCSALALVLGGCPTEGTEVDTSDEAQCSHYTFEPRTACEAIDGTVASREVGTIAPARVLVTVAPTAAGDLARLTLVLDVRTGQALPGTPLLLRRGDEVLGSGVLGGPLGNETRLRVILDHPSCAPTECTFAFDVAASPVSSTVPVPLELEGLVVIAGERREPGWVDVRVEVTDAN